MGKTTTLQACVFALTGGADELIEEERACRWGAKYFRARLNRDSEAKIRVEFFLGEMRIVVERKIASEAVAAVRIGEGDWISDTRLAGEKYENAVLQAGKFPSFTDFRYVVHRLAYLAEHRRDLLWDHRAQLRVMMLVCGDANREARFRDMRVSIQNTNTEKRHLLVNINRIEGHLKLFESFQRSKGGRVARRTRHTKDEGLLKKAESVQAELDAIESRRSELLVSLSEAQAELLVLNTKIESRQEHLSRQEDNLVLNSLRSHETNSSALALQKLVVHERCPYCTQKASHLAANARSALTVGKCPICSQPHLTDISSEEVKMTRSTLLSFDKKRDSWEAAAVSYRSQLELLERDETRLRAQLGKLVVELPHIPDPDTFNLSFKDSNTLAETLKTYRSRHSRLAREEMEMKHRLDNEFKEFSGACAQRLRQVQRRAAEYAVAFLGHECEFVATNAKDKLTDFWYFVPRFDGSVRSQPDMCSESERFFLDIAFRMALVEMTGRYSDSQSTFICETPENALDLAYTDNVANMFNEFAKQGFSLLLTANIQLGGVAKPLLARYPASERRKRVWDLLQAGEPSPVQQKKLRQLTQQLAEILED
jgi:hypothetical protein